MGVFKNATQVLKSDVIYVINKYRNLEKYSLKVYKLYNF